jgi:hypothetical protein
MNCAYSRTDNLHSADTARMSARVVEDETTSCATKSPRGSMSVLVEFVGLWCC